jgi:hypothetical protein
MSAGTMRALVTGDSTPFLSTSALSEAHSALLRSLRGNGNTTLSPALLMTLTDFMARAQATGALIDDLDQRQSIQSILDYWTTVLYRSGYEPPDAILADFDPSLAPTLDESLCPYRGLEAFREDDQHLFFGRRQLVAELIEQLQHKQLLAVIGRSGSGKSSLVMSGLIPALKADALPGSARWRYLPILTPGDTPLENLAHLLAREAGSSQSWMQEQIKLFHKDHRHLARLLSAPHSAPVVLVVDQFEEIFTRNTDEHTQRMFVNNLLSLTMVREIPHRVILTMRSDFVARVALISELKAPFDAARVMITALSASELRDAIERPAASVNLKFEAGVVDALVKEMVGETAALPLLQFTLLQLWRKRERNRVSMRAYRELGGARRALGHSAEHCYQSLIDQDQQTAKRILLKLVRPGDRMDATSQRVQLGDGVEATSSRIRRAELYAEGEDPARVDDVLGKLIAAGLVRETGSGSEAQVEVAHEAVIRNWQRLVDWLEAERQNLRWRVQLQETAGRWLETGKDPSLLLRGSQLEEALQVKKRSKLEIAFIAASFYEEQKAKFEREQAERAKEEARERELELTRERLLRVEAEGQRADVERQKIEERARAEAETRKRELDLTRERLLRAEAERQRAEVERLEAAERARAEIARQRAEEAARQAGRLRLLVATLVIALLFAVAASVWAFQSTAVAEEQRGRAQAEAATSQAAQVQANTAQALAEEQRAQAVTSQAVAQSERDKQAAEVLRRATAVAKAQTAEYAAVTALNLVDAAKQTAEADAVKLATAEAAARDAVNALALRSTSEAQAVAAQQTALVAEQVALVAQQTAEAERSAAELQKERADARTLADRSRIEPIPELRLAIALEAAKRDRSLQVEDALQAAIQTMITPIQHGAAIVSVAWSPNSRSMVTIADDTIARVWDMNAVPPQQTDTFANHTDRLTSVSWSPDGRRIVTTSNDGTARIWEAASGNQLIVLRPPSPGLRMLSAAWSPESQRVVTTSSDQVIRVWDAATGDELITFSGAIDRLTWAAWSPDGRRFITTSGNNAFIWDTTTGQRQLTLSGHTKAVRSATWSPDDQYILTASDDGTARFWSTSNGRLISTLQVNRAGLNNAMWSPSGRYMLLAGRDGAVNVWEVGQTQQLATIPGDFTSANIALWSPDGTRLVVAGTNSDDGIARLYYSYFDDIVRFAQSLPYTPLTQEQLDQALSSSLPTATPTSIAAPVRAP